MRPVEGTLQTTVIDPSATDSDALSTVVFVLGPDAFPQTAASIPGTQALIFNQPPSHTLHILRPILYRNKLDSQPCEAFPTARKRIPSS